MKSRNHFEAELRRAGRRLGRLVAQKNAAYGSSFAAAGEFLQLLYPRGLRAEQYGDALLLVRVFDKCMRIAHRAGAFGESPYQDIAGYGLLGAVQSARGRRKPAVQSSARRRPRPSYPVQAALRRLILARAGKKGKA